ncbi:MAG: SPOR domain-containing protein [Dysgonamonadaceae bacterium]|jgi:hypothetical protein|nr:SPOR domain-containing protein [Dysgonamonadaceae bacterium]
MKRSYFLLFLLCCIRGGLTAQTSVDVQQRPEPGKGTVVINQSPDVRKLIDTPAIAEKIEIVGNKTYLIVPGYRIQVFSGNNHRNSKNEVFTKKSQIENLYSEATTYVNYTAPFWQLRVGDYLSYEEAFYMMHKLMESFPSLKKEIYIVKESVRIFLY